MLPLGKHFELSVKGAWQIAQKQKEYRETHKEELAQKHKEYYKTHKKERMEKLSDSPSLNTAGDADEAAEPYIKGGLKEKDRAKYLEELHASIQRYGKYRQAFLVGGAPLFDAEGE